MTSEDREKAKQELYWLVCGFIAGEDDADTLVMCTETVLRELSRAEGGNGELSQRREMYLNRLWDAAHEAEHRMRIVERVMDALKADVTDPKG